MTTTSDDLIEFVAVCRYRLGRQGNPPQCVAFNPMDWQHVSREFAGYIALHGWTVYGEPVRQFCGLPVLVDHRVPQGIIHVGQKPC